MLFRFSRRLGRLTLLALIIATCGLAGGESVRTTAGASSADDVVDHVVAISVDGLNPAAIRRLGRSGAPNLYRLIDEGASTLNARTAYERTITLPNHTGMVTGRWVTKTGGHRVTFNSDNGSTVHRTAGSYVRSMFDVAHNRGNRTAFYATKEKFDFLDRSWNGTHGARDTVGVDNGRDKISRYFVDTEPANVSRLIARLSTAPDPLSFVHLAYPDRAGHASGFMSTPYLEAVQQTDTQVGRILNAITASSFLRAHTNVVLTSDHGGLGASHSDATILANYRVPFMVWGIGVARGTDLYALNPGDRRDPGVVRPTYAGVQPIRNGEVANLVLDLLDLPSVPGSTTNAWQGLSVR